MDKEKYLRVLVTGARGFIGRQIVAELTTAGHDVIQAFRSSAERSENRSFVDCDFGRDIDVAVWMPRLTGVDAVVNCVGILRETGANTFERVHVNAPTALFTACVSSGVRRVIQISALGHAEDAEFVASKHRGDELLMSLDLDWTVLRPSVVYSPRGSYGGTSLLRALSALPGVIIVPGSGQQKIEPLSGEDLARLVSSLLDTGEAKRRLLEVGGPEVLTIENYLRAWRTWLRLSTPWVIRTPNWIMAFGAWLGEHFGNGPMGTTMHKMLARGNTVRNEHRAAGAGAWSPQPLAKVLAANPSFVQDRWHAKLYFLVPLLRVCLGILWIASAAAGFLTPQQEIRAILQNAGVTAGAVALVYGASAVDLLLGLSVILGKHLVPIGLLMLVSLAAYTVFIGIELPAMWLEPFGGLIKNLVLAPAVLIMMATADKQ